MNFSQKLILLVLIAISTAYIYFSFFSEKDFQFTYPREENIPADNETVFSNEDDKKNQQKEIQMVKIFVTDTKGDLRSLNRKCDSNVEKSCFEFSIKELISGPTKWEKSKGLSSEIPTGTKILSVRESEKSIMLDLSSTFEQGGGAESTYIKVKQVIKTANANTDLPVYLYINGKQANVIGGEGIMIKQPLGERSLDE